VEHSTHRIVLASASPRRRQLLTAGGYDVVVDAVNADETWPPGGIEQGLLTICRRKLAHAAPYVYPTVAADTVVTLGKERFGKPHDEIDARNMLSILSGREHTVMTGFCVRYGDEERAAVIATRVTFRQLTAVEIARYVATTEPMDKAGAYGIQGEGGALVETIAGSYTNVVGLPLTEVRRAIEELSAGALP
jgi:septum formation protein